MKATQANIIVKTINERKQKIEELLGQEPKRTVNFNFDQRNYECPEIKIDSDYLIYRLENTRTISQQIEEADGENLEEGFFNRDMENVSEVQARQHKLLFNEVDKKLEKAFEAKGGQTEGIVVTLEGRVVNGNRRLAYMREQSAEGQGSYNEITCVILQDGNLHGADKEAEIEAYLDYAPNAKKEYGWVNQGLAIEIMHEQAGKSFKEISIEKSLKEVEVEKLYEKIKLAKESLERRNQKNKFSLLQNSEQIYSEIGNFLVAKKEKLEESEKEQLKAGLFIFDAAESGVIGNRPYDYVQWLKTNIKRKDIINSLFKDSIGLQTDSNNPFGSTEGTFKTSRINEIISDVSEANIFAEKMKTFIEAEQLQKKNQDKKNITKNELNKANTAVSTAKLPLLTGDADQNIEGVRETIENIKNNLAELEQKLFE